MESFKKLSLKARLIMAFLTLGLIPMIASGILTFKKSVQTVEHEAHQQLISMKEAKAAQVETMFEDMRKQTITMAYGTEVVDAVREFTAAYKQYANDLKNKVTPENAKAGVLSYYTEQFGAEYRKKAGGETLDFEKWINNLSPPGLFLQYSYISSNTNPLGSKHKLDFANDDTTYAKTHKKYHPSFRNFVDKFGFYDLFLVDTEGNVVYTNFKELDFATNLKTGSWSQTGLAQAYTKALAANEGETALTELEPYRPSYEAPAAFVGAPIFSSGEKIGVLLFQIPVERLNIILTNDKHWKDTGFGETGEAYVVGSDKILRSVARAFVETPDSYLLGLQTHHFPEDKMKFLKAQNTTALTVKLDTPSIEEVIKGHSGVMSQVDAFGDPTIASYKPLKINGLNWFLITEMKESEKLASVYELSKSIAMIGLISLILVATFAWLMAHGISSKLIGFVSKLKDVTTETDQCSTLLKTSAGKVSSASEEQAAAIQETVATLNEITAMVNKSVDNAKRSTEKADISHSVAQDGKQVVNEMTRAMNDINESNDFIAERINESNKNIAGIVEVINQIATKTQVINDIVFQTKLLSFNASIEAARAGEQGKGFAVVAEEVGNLAQMSGTAAKEITEMLNSSIQKVEAVVRETGSSVEKLIQAGKSKVEDGVKIAKRCEEVLDEVVVNVADVRLLMGEIASASHEQAQGVNNITTAMNQLDQTTHINAESAQHTSMQSEVLTKQGDELKSVVIGIEIETLGKSDLTLATATSAKDSQTTGRHKIQSKNNVAQKQKAENKNGGKVLAFKKAESKATQPKTASTQTKIAAGTDIVPSADDPGFEEF